MAENYQARAFWLRASNSAPETIPRYRYNYIDMILSVWVYRYRYIDRLLSIGCYRICVRLYGDGVRLFMRVGLFVQFIQNSPPFLCKLPNLKKIAIFAYNGNKNYWRLPYVFDIIQASRGGRRKRGEKQTGRAAGDCPHELWQQHKNRYSCGVCYPPIGGIQ